MLKQAAPRRPWCGGTILGWTVAMLILSGCSSAPDGSGASEGASTNGAATADSGTVPAAVNAASAEALPTESASAAATPAATPAQAAPTSETSNNQYEDQYATALNLAGSTSKLVQQAQSLDDWSLIVGRWQRTIAQLKAIPHSASSHAAAQGKIAEYESNLAYAQAQLDRLSNPPEPVPLAQVTTPTATSQSQSLSVSPSPSSGSANRFTVPIVSRSGGTPVIMVTFNGGTSFPMILDTGASGTLITQTVADRLGLSPTGQIRAATASARSVTLSTTRVDSLTVGSITRRNITVAVGDAVSVGLLGNDFHQGYDIVIRANTVEFIRR